MSKLRDMLFTSAHADRAKALLTLELLEKNPAGIGDHSTGDFYKNAEEALDELKQAASHQKKAGRCTKWLICIMFCMLVGVGLIVYFNFIKKRCCSIEARLRNF